MKIVITKLSVLFSILISIFGFGGTNILKEGDKSPDFILKSTDGKEITLSSYKGKIVVLYFYPKDNTPGCTIEACEFRDSYLLYKEAGIEVFGVSVDDVDSHKKFVESQKINFTLLADSDKKVSEQYGVLNKMGMSDRTTFLIDKNGLINKIYKNVSPKEHAKKVLDDAKKL